MARYHILHKTLYDYGSAVSLSQQMLHLTPRTCPWQHCEQFDLILDPEPSWRQRGEDAFGNPVEWVAFHQAHEALHIHAELSIEVKPHLPASMNIAPAWDELVTTIAYRGGEAPRAADLAAKRFLFESPYVRIKHELKLFAADCFPAGRGVLEATQALMNKIHTEFEFDPEATTVATPILEVLENKKGVCQDFAHLMIGCLRAIGIPARYISGYLLTHPPEGQPRMVGADASHAWVSVYTPGSEHGWVDFDPTNNLLPDTQHITLAWGRDFSDVSPLRGIILGGGGHEPEVEVTVTPIDG